MFIVDKMINNVSLEIIKYWPNIIFNYHTTYSAGRVHEQDAGDLPGGRYPEHG